MVNNLNKITIDARILIWILGSVFTVIISLAGIIYSSVNKRLDEKANKDVMVYMQNDISEIKQDIKTLLER